MMTPYLSKDIEKNGKKGLELHIQASWEDLHFNNEDPLFKNNYAFVEVYFNEGVRFSSAGIVDWMRFYKSFGEIPFYFFDCSYSVMSYASLFPSFFPKNSIIQSFYLPYYDSENDSTKNVLINRGKDFDDNGIIRLPQVKNDKGQLLEVDVTPEKYFKILKKS
jgi:hypothetical protein